MARPDSFRHVDLRIDWYFQSLDMNFRLSAKLTITRDLEKVAKFQIELSGWALNIFDVPPLPHFLGVDWLNYSQNDI